MALELKITISRIAKFEKETGRSLMDMETESSVSMLFDMIQYFSGATDDEIDQYVAEHGIEPLGNLLTEAMEKSGFLAGEQAQKVLAEQRSKTSQKPGKV